MELTRRDLLKTTATVAAAMAVPNLLPTNTARAADAPTTAPALAPTGFTLPPLPYAYDALEPAIDATTMHLHHDKHHAAYIANLNKALVGHPELLAKDPITLIQQIDQVPAPLRQPVINNGGGHVNHSLFWQMMAPKAGGDPNGPVADAITKSFGSFADLQKSMNDAAAKRFGSGWAWLVADKTGKLLVTSTANQDSPYSLGQTPLLGVDVWEHAYYLHYQNRRPDYVKAWWSVVNWDFVNTQLKKALA
jgi:Fe-Mn family superoxide dismutase